MRKTPSPAEARLWAYLRNHQRLGFSFRRQHPVGPYIVDFCCSKAKLIIELDGGQHIDQECYDQTRTAYLQEKGYKVFRFWNNQVMDEIEGVILVIEDELKCLGS